MLSYGQSGSWKIRLEDFGVLGRERIPQEQKAGKNELSHFYIGNYLVTIQNRAALCIKKAKMSSRKGREHPNSKKI